MNGLLIELGSVPYLEAWAMQRELVGRRRAGAIPDTLVLLEHPPTYTIGRSGSRASVVIDHALRHAAGIELHEVDRGGDATYHGPGQVVGYPIVDLRARGGDVHRFLREVEEILLRSLADLGIVGQRDGRYTGVWVGSAKVAAIGAKVTGGVTSHGFALNVDPEMAHWAGIVPCGIAGAGVTSLRTLLGRSVSRRHVRATLARQAGAVFGLRWRRARSVDGLMPTAGA